MKTEVSIAKDELVEKRRYLVLLRAVSLGLKLLGVSGVSFSGMVEKDGRLFFEMEKKD